ncbi:MAG: hypothetical protein WA432_05075 [Candidatus Babeliaceae bacterium]
MKYMKIIFLSLILTSLSHAMKHQDQPQNATGIVIGIYSSLKNKQHSEQNKQYSEITTNIQSNGHYYIFGKNINPE